MNTDEHRLCGSTGLLLDGDAPDAQVPYQESGRWLPVCSENCQWSVDCFEDLLRLRVLNGQVVMVTRLGNRPYAQHVKEKGHKQPCEPGEGWAVVNGRLGLWGGGCGGLRALFVHGLMLRDVGHGGRWN